MTFNDLPEYSKQIHELLELAKHKLTHFRMLQVSRPDCSDTDKNISFWRAEVERLQNIISSHKIHKSNDPGHDPLHPYP